MKHTAILITLAALVCLSPAVQAEEGETPAVKLIARHADSIVSIKFVRETKIPMMQIDEETSGEAHGVVLSKDGLVLTASSTFEGGVAGQMMRMMGQEIEVKTTVSDLKVRFGTEEKEYDAQLVAKDSNLGLAFLKIQDLGDRSTKPLSVLESRATAVGADVLCLCRMGRGFDSAPMISRAYVTAAVERPREMWALNLEGANLLGMPAFTEAGALVGFLSLQRGAEGAESKASGFLGIASSAQNMGGFLIPAKALKPLVEAATKQAAELAKEAAEAAAESEGDDAPA